MDTEQEIREREQQKNSDTPALDGDDEGDGGDGDGGLSLPSLSKKHMAILGVVVALGVAYWLYKRQDDGGAGGSGTLDSARSEVDGTTEATVEGDDEDDDEIRVEHDPNNPLAADETVVKEFRDRGIISDPDEQQEEAGAAAMEAEQ